MSLFILPIDWFGLIISLLLFHFNAMCIYIHYKQRIKGWMNFTPFEKYLLFLGFGLGFYSFFGYILDLFFNLSLLSLSILTIINLFVLIIIKRNDILKMQFLSSKLAFQKIKEYLMVYNKLLIERIKDKEKVVKFIMFFSFGIFFLYFSYLINFSYILNYTGIAMNDPIVNYSKIRLSILNNHLTWNPRLIGLRNWIDLFYPMGFYLVNILLLLPCEHNIFYFAIFFGPIFGFFRIVQYYYISKNISQSKWMGYLGGLFLIDFFMFRLFSVLSVSSGLALFFSNFGMYYLFCQSRKDYFLSGLFFGCGFLTHPFTGGLFFVGGAFVYVILEAFTQKNLKSIFGLFVLGLSISLPYFVLLLSSNIVSRFLPTILIINTSSYYPLIILLSVNTGIDFSLINFSSPLYQIYGPKNFFLVLGLTSFIKIREYYKQIVALFINMLFSYLLFFNALFLNGTQVLSFFYSYYPAERTMFGVIINLLILILIGFLGMKDILINIIEKIKKNKLIAELRGKKRAFLSFPTYIFMFWLLLSNFSFYSEKNFVTYKWENFVPLEFTETIHWIDRNVELSFTVVYDSINSYFIDERPNLIKPYFQTLAIHHRFICIPDFFNGSINSSNFIENLSLVNNTRFLMILNHTQLQLLSDLYENLNLDIIFFSRAEKYFLVQYIHQN